MSAARLYRGFGGNWSPHAEFVDALISARMKPRGFSGKRAGKTSIHATPRLEQALDYAKNGQATHVEMVTPLPGSVVTWVPDMTDMLLAFETHVRELYWDGHACPVLRDAAGDVNVLDTYLSMGRQKKAISRLVDDFLATVEPQEFVVGDDEDVIARLGPHTGEVWITGPYDSEPYVEADTELSPTF